MATQQTDTVAMTEEQLDGVSGGPHIRNYRVTAPIQQRRSNRTADTGRVVAIWTTGGTLPFGVPVLSLARTAS